MCQYKHVLTKNIAQNLIDYFPFRRGRFSGTSPSRGPIFISTICLKDLNSYLKTFLTEAQPNIQTFKNVIIASSKAKSVYNLVKPLTHSHHQRLLVFAKLFCQASLAPWTSLLDHQDSTSSHIKFM